MATLTRRVRRTVAVILLCGIGAACQRSGGPQKSPATGSDYPFAGGYPTPESARKLYDELDYQRAVQAYVWAVPLVNSVAMAKALTDAGVSVSAPSLLVFNRPLTPKQILMTANAEVIYAMTVVDLSQTGVLVIDVPDGVLGGVVDYWQRAVGDIGIGESGHGGKFLLVPPDHQGALPPGYLVTRPKTSRVFIFGRGILVPGHGPDAFVDLVSHIRIYPWTQRQAPPPTRIVMNDGKPFDSDWPKDARYFASIANGLTHVPIEADDKVMYAMLRPLGIEHGRAFAPDERVKGILERAATVGGATVATMAFANRLKGTRPLWADRQWEHILFTSSPDSATEKWIELDERTQWYQLEFNGRYGYGAPLVPGTGSWYASTFHDGSGVYLNGAKTYKLSVAANPPAKQFWSATVYDNRTRSMIDTDQQKAGLSTYSDLKKNPDGSIDLFFGPAAPTGMERNWIKTIPDQGFFVMFRLYGPLEPVFDGSWKLNDVVEVK